MSRPHDLQFEGPRPELVPAFVAPDHAFSLVAGRVGQKVNQIPHGAYKHYARQVGGVQVTITEDDIDRLTARDSQ
jgi:hypothetical protein